jgi:NDP-sugar pyrophosphorylase family protein
VTDKADQTVRKLPVRLQRADGYWMDIGRPPDYAQATVDFGDSVRELDQRLPISDSGRC